MPPEHVISAPDIESIYDVPLNFEKDKIGGFDPQIAQSETRQRRRRSRHVEKFRKEDARIPKARSTSPIVGKYFDTGDFVLSDAYFSVIEAIKFSAYKCRREATYNLAKRQEISKPARRMSRNCRSMTASSCRAASARSGIEGKIMVIRYCTGKQNSLFWTLLRNAAGGD